MALPQQFKDNIKNMTDQLGSLNISRVNLNKYQSKSWAWGNSKGVKEEILKKIK